MYVEYVPKSNAPKPINWIAVRAEYEAGGISLRQLAEKIGASLRTVARRSSKEAWVLGVHRMATIVATLVAEKERDNAVNQKVEQTLSDLDKINNVINCIYDAITEDKSNKFKNNFKTSGEMTTALDRLLKVKLEYSDEHVQKWLLDRGYAAIPISELATQSEMGEIETKSEIQRN